MNIFFHNKNHQNRDENQQHILLFQNAIYAIMEGIHFLGKTPLHHTVKKPGQKKRHHLTSQHKYKTHRLLVKGRQAGIQNAQQRVHDAITKLHNLHHQNGAQNSEPPVRTARPNPGRGKQQGKYGQFSHCPARYEINDPGGTYVKGKIENELYFSAQKPGKKISPKKNLNA